MITVEDFSERMRKIYEENDIENGHKEADDLMCDVLRELGYSEGIDIFIDMEKWYS